MAGVFITGNWERLGDPERAGSEAFTAQDNGFVLSWEGAGLSQFVVREECAGDAGVLFVLIAGLVITKVLDPGMAQRVVGVM